MQQQPSINILCLETANAITSVAIAPNGNCLAYKTITESNKAADKLHLLVSELFQETNFTFNDISAIAVSTGPGSYTGLRIAAAAAKGYAIALNLPIIAVPTLETMVNGIQQRYHHRDYDVFVPMIDARRMEVFTSFYTKELEIVQHFSGLIIDDSIIQFINENTKYLFFGNGASKAIPFINANSVSFFSDFEHSAEDLCALAHARFLNNQFEDIAYFEPNYTKAVHITTSNK